VAPHRFRRQRFRRLSAGRDKPHRYQFVIWALITGEIATGCASGAMLGFFLNAALGQARLTATYGR
jgi:phosphatidylethanolamine-binding protein (PEBP) family uncharacterized protein